MVAITIISTTVGYNEISKTRRFGIPTQISKKINGNYNERWPTAVDSILSLMMLLHWISLPPSRAIANTTNGSAGT